MSVKSTINPSDAVATLNPTDTIVKPDVAVADLTVA